MENIFNFSAVTADGVEVVAKVKPNGKYFNGQVFINGKLWFNFSWTDFLGALGAVTDVLHKIKFD